jgi:plastocyanin
MPSQKRRSRFDIAKLHRRDFMASVAIGAAALAFFRRPVYAKPRIIEVSMGTALMTFLPATVTIKVGDTVRWTNPGIVSHIVNFDPARAKQAGSVSLPAGVGPFNSEEMEKGDTFSHLFTVRGTYHYTCRYHENMGMTGTIIVR